MSTADIHWSGSLARDVQFGYLSEGIDGPRQHHPRVILNASDASVLRVLREEIKRCRAFTFSVAFVSPSALAMLKTDFLEFRGKGRIITSDYLAFNSPAAFAELLCLEQRGFDVRIHRADAFHPKGYIFEHEDTVSAMVGSANLTAKALTQNHEWNLLVTAAQSADLASQFRDLVRQQIVDSSPITQEWLEEYSQKYTPPPARPKRQQQPPPSENTVGSGLPPVDPGGEYPTPTSSSTAPETTSPAPAGQMTPSRVEPPLLLPNRMQREALAAIEKMRRSGCPRAVVISATGTGKTILSALGVRAAKPRRMLFVVHREQILDRTIQEYQRVLGGSPGDFGKLSGSSRQTSAKYLFATVQTLSQPHVLGTFARDEFDYIVLDEAHRAAAASHRRVMDHFTPQFLMGMTATPERTDGFNVFELFDYNVPYEIRLNRALEEDMLSPFHYYGVTDITFDDGTTTSDVTDLKRLTSSARVRHIVKALETYGQAGIQPRGLIFCSRTEEAHSLSRELNESVLHGRGLRTAALTGADPVPRREAVVRELEAGLLDYIVTVDVFNEGVDIPTVNQVIMLRQTQSPIIFVQQLGRGLRKAPNKEYLVVVDFIGNYANNYMIPIALFGDNSLNKESLRRNLIAAEEKGVIAGLSSVQFDRIAHERVMRSLASVKLDSMSHLKTTLVEMQNRVGGTPRLWDFVRFDSADPIVLATSRDNFPMLLASTLKVQFDFSPQQFRFLSLLSQEVLTAKRPHDAALVQLLIDDGPLSLAQIHEELATRWPHTTSLVTRSSVDTLTLEHHAEADLKRYRRGIATLVDGQVELVPEFLHAYRSNTEFSDAVDDLLRTADHTVADRYEPGREFTIGRQYGRKEVTRLLGWPRKWTSTLYGYRVNNETLTCPIFVTLHKSDDVAASTAYEDALVDHQTMVWFTRSRRNLNSEEVRQIVNNEVDLHVFVKKDDAEGTDFYYLGQVDASGAEERTMPDKDGKPLSVVRMLLRFKQSIPASLYDYFHPVVTEVES